MPLCGLRPEPNPRRPDIKGKAKAKQVEENSSDPTSSDEVLGDPHPIWDSHFQWAREDQLSAILGFLDESSRRNTPNLRDSNSLRSATKTPNWGRVPRSTNFRRTSFADKDNIAGETGDLFGIMSHKSSSPGLPKPIQPPPRDVCARRRDVEVDDPVVADPLSHSSNQSPALTPAWSSNTSPPTMPGNWVLRCEIDCSPYQRLL